MADKVKTVLVYDEIETTQGAYSKGQPYKMPEQLHAKAMPEEEYKTCPFKSGISRRCTKKCALSVNDTCLIKSGLQGEYEPNFGICPFSDIKCTDACALYSAKGCAMIPRNRKD